MSTTNVTPNHSTSALDSLSGSLIVSCQARPGEPLAQPGIMRLMAQSSIEGGAGGVMAGGPADIREIREVTELPLIGLWKDGRRGTVYITPTINHVISVIEAGADAVAIDATFRPRSDGGKVEELIDAVHSSGSLAIANISTKDEGIAAIDKGADAISTCLAGYTDYSSMKTGPDFSLIESLASSTSTPVIAEGRISTPADFVRALSCGAHAVVVGRAITNPESITRSFIKTSQAANFD